MRREVIFVCEKGEGLYEYILSQADLFNHQTDWLCWEVAKKEEKEDEEEEKDETKPVVTRFLNYIMPQTKGQEQKEEDTPNENKESDKKEEEKLTDMTEEEEEKCVHDQVGQIPCA
jgi:hypothetical protein